MAGWIDWVADRWQRRQPRELRWAPPARDIPRNPGLEDRVRRDPDDRTALGVYGDFLADAGDPRGDVLNAWLQATGDDPDPAVAAAITAWTTAHGSALTARIGIRRSWRMHATFRGPLLDAWGHRLGSPDVGDVLTAPESLALRALRLSVSFRGGRRWLDALAARPRPSALRELELKWGLETVDLSDRWPVFDGLESLRIDMFGGRLGPVTLPTVKRLSIGFPLDGDSGCTTVHAPALECLSIPSTLEHAALARFLEAHGLRELRLAWASPATLAILEHPGIARLRALRVHVSHGDPLAVASAMVGCRAALEGVGSIVLESDDVSLAARDTLTHAFGARVSFGDWSPVG